MSILFISHSAPDSAIAEALRSAINDLLRESDAKIRINYSSSADQGPQGGDEWRKWIEQQVVDATTAVVLLTRESVTRPWPLWEAAACRGVALQRALDGQVPVTPRIIPLTYGISNDECPDPFRSEQIKSGEDASQMETVFTQLLEYHGVEANALFKAGKVVENVLATYMQKVRAALLNAPSLVTEATVQDWLKRLDRLADAQRWSELENFHRWMNFAFGRDQQTLNQQIDLRLHRRLGDYHLEQRNFVQAIEQLRLARETAPRDIYVLSRLTEALIKSVLEIEDGDSKKLMQTEIEDLLHRITSLDADAFYLNPDTAALAAKFERRINNAPQKAAEIYQKALELNPDSYYLADVLGQTRIELGQIDAAKKVYREALEILERIPDNNVWSLATKTTASLVLNDIALAIKSYSEILDLKPSKNELASITGGVRELVDKLGLAKKNKDKMLAALKA